MAVQEFPKWMYGPGGKSKIFQKDEQVPKGWVDHPDKLGKAAAKDPKQKQPEKSAADAEPTPEEKADTIRQIREAADAAGITIELGDDASVEEINAAIDKLTAVEGDK